MALKKILFLVVVIGCCSTSSNANDQLRSCVSQRDCRKNECCVEHPLRYPTPYCTRLRQKGEPCVPPSKHINSSAVHIVRGGDHPSWIICPCMPTLTCDWFSGLCSRKGIVV
ncbi:uncharacterized protein LOC135165414 [Diachasmimorpha longicaudata]|uniref:uncharacterized protein LOC135165414 n=1 Tax=Diachasmimorpha longicaudata TaxID=58733 RepID=UPI0030B8E92F